MNYYLLQMSEFNIMQKNESDVLILTNLNNNNKIAVFDLDDTLIHEGFAEGHNILCEHTMQILNYLTDKNIKIVIASHNLSAIKILKSLEIDHYFNLILGYHDYSDKASHIWKISQHFNCPISDCILFDDLVENIRKVRMQGAHGVLVDWKIGVTIDDVLHHF